MTGQYVIERGQAKAYDHAQRVETDHDLVWKIQTARDNRTGDADEQKTADQMRPDIVSLCGSRG